MTAQFFPRDRQFWIYHCSALVFTSGVTLASTLVWGSAVGNDTAATIAWLLPYTIAVLCFRALYLRRSWRRLPMSRMIVVVVVFGLVSGVAVMGCVLAIVLPFFWRALQASQAGLQLWPYVARMLVGGGLQNQLFICAWIFIYISTTTNRDAKQVELLNLRLQNSVKEARLSSLSNQLNPHFLFNSLNNIRFMVHENAMQADAMIVALSEILRYSLAGGEREKVALGEELAIIRRYIAIVAVQLEQRLRFSLEVTEAHERYLIPPMVLQMLVENAVKHGLDQLEHGGALHVDVGVEEEYLRLRVRNDMPSVPRGNSTGMSIGLRNIAQRLQLLYGDKAVLTVSQEGEEFVATLLFPLEFAQ